MIGKNCKHFAFTPAESVRKPLLNLCSRKFAFTLAEVLITLAIIGIVAALTIPTLIQNHNEKAWATAKNLWEKKLVEVTRRMNIDGVMTGHRNTTYFLRGALVKYMKIIKICGSANIKECYAPKIITTGKDGEIEIDPSKIMSSTQLGLKSWEVPTSAFVAADGTTAIIAYNPNCEYVDPYSPAGQAGQVNCLGMIIDVNGKKGPNQVGKDIMLTSGVTISNCDNPIRHMCFSTDFQPSPINTCDGTNPYDSDFRSNGCEANDWAGAKKACDEKGMRLPTRAELAQLASYIYGEQIGEKDDYNGDAHRPILTLDYDYWSSEQWTHGDDFYENEIGAYGRFFGPSGTIGCDTCTCAHKRGCGDYTRAICIGD